MSPQVTSPTRADNETKKDGFAAAGPWIAMAAAVILTAKGEFDLAVLAHFSEWIAWMFPVMIDVYVITAFHRRRWKDMVIGMLLMIFCQIAVHLLPVYITGNEKTPWGLVVAVACIAPIVVVRVKILTGRTAKEIAAEQEAAQRTDEVRAARTETTAARRALAETEARASAETERALVETEAREAAEIRAADAERRAETEAETRAEIQAAAQAEIERHERAAGEAAEAVRVAEQRAAEQAELARLAEGRLAEARESADRAAAARVLAEQNAAAQVEQVTTAAEQAEQQLRQALAGATAASQQAEQKAAELAETVRLAQAQRDDAQRYAEEQTGRRVLAEQSVISLERARDAALDELERVRRQLARAQERAETAQGRQPEITRGSSRKSLTAVPVVLPDDLPKVETVSPETVALILAARAHNPGATQAEISAVTGKTDRTVRKVLKTVPAEIAGRVLALTDGRVA